MKLHISVHTIVPYLDHAKDYFLVYFEEMLEENLLHTMPIVRALESSTKDERFSILEIEHDIRDKAAIRGVYVGLCFCRANKHIRRLNVKN